MHRTNYHTHNTIHTLYSNDTVLSLPPLSLPPLPLSLPQPQPISQLFGEFDDIDDDVSPDTADPEASGDKVGLNAMNS